jgi:hypothetical protein
MNDEFEVQGEEPEDGVEIVFEQTEVLDEAESARDLEARLSAAPGKLKKLEDEATKRGYKAETGPRSTVAIRHKVRAAQAVKPPAGEQGAPVKEVQFEVSLRSYKKAGSKDTAAVGTMTVIAGQTRDEYDVLLEAPGGNMGKAREFKLHGNNVVPANSWWTAARGCVTSKCGSACIAALTTCPPTSWAAYLLCLAARCGGCWVKCAACASCNCRWYCKWATGCCRH